YSSSMPRVISSPSFPTAGPSSKGPATWTRPGHFTQSISAIERRAAAEFNRCLPPRPSAQSKRSNRNEQNRSRFRDGGGEEAMKLTTRTKVISHDLAAVVDSSGPGKLRTRDVQQGINPVA